MLASRMLLMRPGSHHGHHMWLKNGGIDAMFMHQPVQNTKLSGYTRHVSRQATGLLLLTTVGEARRCGPRVHSYTNPWLCARLPVDPRDIHGSPTPHFSLVRHLSGELCEEHSRGSHRSRLASVSAARFETSLTLQLIRWHLQL
jgi:hypothetical protein